MKKEIVQKIIDAQQASLEGLVDRIQTLDLAVDLDETDTQTIDDYSQQDMYSEHSDYLDDEKIYLENNLSQLKLSYQRSNSNISPGALIVTDNNYYLVGPSFETLDYNGKNVYPISTLTKIYTDNKGKKAGEVLELQSKKEDQIIQDIQ